MSFTVNAVLSGQIMVLIEIIKNILPDELENKWLPIIAIGIGIGLAIATKQDWSIGLMSALGAIGGHEVLNVGVKRNGNGQKPTPDVIKG